ncbi:MAG TPA: hypothetical protein VKT72_11185 [Candidatus Baltobacteraceae bacterium]|nr:hypothetical protein [Candidatus Baltobacteraceae bacterium]
MNAETVSAWAALGTLLVISASAVAALIQLRHMRAGNQLEALLSLEQDFRAAHLQAALRYIQEDLPLRMSDAAYRRELETIGFIDADVHPELTVCNWFNTIGTLVKHRLVSEETFMDLFARLIVYCWKQTAPAIAIMRRSRGDFQYHDFEYLDSRARAWLQRNPRGYFPAATARVAMDDPWVATDHPDTQATAR